MFDQTLIRVCLILGSFITAGYILRRVQGARPVQAGGRKSALHRIY